MSAFRCTPSASTNWTTGTASVRLMSVINDVKSSSCSSSGRSAATRSCNRGAQGGISGALWDLEVCVENNRRASSIEIVQ